MYKTNNFGVNRQNVSEKHLGAIYAENMSRVQKVKKKKSARQN